MGPAQAIPESLPPEKDAVTLRHILGADFRANPAYELVLFDRLPTEQQEALKDLKNDPDFYGVLLPRPGSGRAIKSVCRNTALLYLTLTQPGPLPSYLRGAFGNECNRAVAELVLDGVLEIGCDGRFVSGSEAYERIYPGAVTGEPGGTLARLARAALEYAQALDIDDSARLSARLYFYNRIPLSARWMSRCHSEDSTAVYLGLSKHRKQIERQWSRMQLAPPFNGWFQWQSRELVSKGENAHSGYKLYVSPQPDFLPQAFETVLEVLKDSGAHHFKVGNDAAGLLRPDKLVLYFWSFDELQETAQQVLKRLETCPAHGVPFTAEITPDGLLSWGFDPPPDKGALAWRERESWRLWITNRLATALLAARKTGGAGIEPWQFALERLRLEHVDTDTWAPTDSFGRRGAGQ